MRKVPFYQQTAEFSCGPASLAMALAHFRPGTRLDRDLEFELWRDTHLPQVYGATRFGIAVAAARHGLGAHIVSSCRDLGFVEQVPKFLQMSDRGMRFFAKAQWRQAAKLGVTEESRDPGLEDLRAILKVGGLPILFVSTRIFIREDIPHWVLVTGLEVEGGEEHLHLHNPLDHPGRLKTKFRGQRVMENAEFFGERGLVAIFKDPAAAVRFARTRKGSHRVRAPALPPHFVGPRDIEFRTRPGVKFPGIPGSLADLSTEEKRRERKKWRREAARLS